MSKTTKTTKPTVKKAKKPSGEKKKSRRSRSKHPALNPRFAPKVRKDYLDFDYLNQLSPEEKDWLNKFVDEELHASFKNDERDLNKTQEEKRRVYSNNNSRNRDLYGVTKANRLLSGIDDVGNPEWNDGDEVKGDLDINYSESYNMQEDAMIARLDRKKKKK
jgi:hypothetical protein